MTGFNSFFLASDIRTALREARRVTLPGGSVATTVFGHPDRCDSTAMFRAVAELLPASPAAEEHDDGAPALHEEGVLSSLAVDAGLVPREEDSFGFVERYRPSDDPPRGDGGAADGARRDRGRDRRGTRAPHRNLPYLPHLHGHLCVAPINARLRWA